mmetsp:Transcript_12819/g.21321  ORF Transcript_12819/g.21321 Transcript_12819/m.21321 type:complete len:90 (+) Transcript_12819:143-412(+)
MSTYRGGNKSKANGARKANMSLARQSSSQQGLSGVQDLFEDPVTNGLGDTGELSLVSTWSDPEQFVTGDDLACTSDLGALAGGGKASLH